MTSEGCGDTRGRLRWEVAVNIAKNQDPLGLLFVSSSVLEKGNEVEPA